MKQLKKYLIGIAVFYLTVHPMFGQKTDTSDVNGYHGQWKKHFQTGQYDSAAFYAGRALALSEKLNYNTGISTALTHLGLIEWRKGNYKKALELHEKALALNKNEGYKSRVPSNLNNIGLVYWTQGETSRALDYFFEALEKNAALSDSAFKATVLDNIGLIFSEQGNYPKALDFHLRALKISERYGNRNDIAGKLNNIGLAYYNQLEYNKALAYFQDALKINRETGNKAWEAINLGNIGLTYYDRAELEQALPYYLMALEIAENINDKNGTARHLANIGLIYHNQTDKIKNKAHADTIRKGYDLALENYSKALKMDEEIGNKIGIARDLGHIGALYKTLRKFKRSEEYLQKALEVSTAINSIPLQMDHHLLLSALFEQQGDYKRSFRHYDSYMAAKDSLFNEEKSAEFTRHELNYEFEKEEARKKAEQAKKDAVANAESKKQEVIILMSACALLLLFVFSGFVFRSLRVTRKQKTLIEIKNTETEKQKQIIEEKNKDIIDSIYYARRIQQSLLPTEKYFIRNLTENK